MKQNVGGDGGDGKDSGDGVDNTSRCFSKMDRR